MSGPLENIADNSSIVENVISENQEFIEYNIGIIWDEIEIEETEVIDLHTPMQEFNDDLRFNSSNDDET